MIAACFDPADESIARRVIRGAPVSWWLPRLFPRWTFDWTPGKLRQAEYAVLIDLTRLCRPPEDSERKIFTFLAAKNLQDGQAAAVADGSLYIFKANDPVITGRLDQPGIKKWLAERGGLVTIPVQLPSRAEASPPLAVLHEVILVHQLHYWHSQGVDIEDPSHFHIDAQVAISAGTRIGTGVVIRGETRIGTKTVIHPYVSIEESRIEDGCVLLPFSVVREAHLKRGSQIGPYTHLRPGAVLEAGAKAGNFVEMKKTVLGEKSKAMHLSYLGDTVIGNNVNVGAGTITCNYDGEKKHRTQIESGAFIGSGTELVAPVTVGSNSVVAAGSTVTEDVPPDSLAVARARQLNKSGWVKRKRKSRK